VGNVSAKTSTTVTLTSLRGLAANATTTTSAAAVALYNRDTNIKIIGGTWARGANGGTTGGQCSIFLRHIDGLIIDIENATSTAGKQTIYFGDISRFEITQRNSNVYSGMTQGIGPLFNGRIPYTTGTAGDDVVALVGADWPSTGNDTAGDIQNVEVGTIHATTLANLFKLLAGNSCRADGVVVDKVMGSAGINAAWIGDDAAQPETTGGTYGDVEVKYIDANVATTGSGTPVSLPSPSADRIKFGTIRWSSTGVQSYAIYLGGASTATLGQLIVDSIDMPAGTLSGAVYCNGPGLTVDSLVINAARWVQTTSANNFVNVFQGTINEVTFGPGVKMICQAGGGQYGLVVNGGTVGNLRCLGGSYTNGGSLFRTRAGMAAMTVQLVGTYIKGMSRVANVFSPVTVVMEAPIFDTIGVQAFFVNGGSLVLRGTMTTIGAFTLLQRQGGAEAVEVVGLTIPADLSALTKTNGDMANNTNGSLACGVGPAVCNGTNWKNLYSGATY
jgi:hypothetical protein